MNPYLRRLIEAVMLVAVIASGIAIQHKTENGLQWEQVLSTRFWVLSIIHIIPAYFLVWSFEDKYEYWTHFKVILLVIFTGWAIVFGIICLISHFVFGFDLI